LASLMEDLIDVLNKEEEQYQGLIELGKKKREVVIRILRRWMRLPRRSRRLPAICRIWRRREPEY
jgi:hypothetical protein